MGFAAVARVTDQQWILCSVRDDIDFGLEAGDQLELKTTICDEIRQTGKEVVIDHVAQHPDFRHHHTPAMYGFQSYISVPIILRDGSLFGTLCAIDPNPAKLDNPATVGMFKLYCELISLHLHNLDTLEGTQKQLKEELAVAELREQFIAILGHDLRNPLGAVNSSAQMIALKSSDDKVKQLANVIKNSAKRMDGLIENMLDFARGRLGGGINIAPTKDANMERLITQVVAELQAISPENQIEVSTDLQETVDLDESRIAQLLSNLLGNALHHGDPSQPVRIVAKSNTESFTLTVSNFGPEIPVAIRERLFQPFARGAVKPGDQGLGLGLYIASEIAKAHGAQLQVDSEHHQTHFTFLLPKRTINPA
ncbi:MAG: GAF domain-containing sensor histidine kinase [Pedobacter sp.]|nr:MAG: GAF domain-containing sensor histidine kinase [Pedobacter sp.]